MVGRLTGALRERFRRLRPGDRRRGAAHTSAPKVAAAAAIMSFAAFAGILATLWLVAAGGGKPLDRDVVIALPPAIEARSDAAPPPSAGIDGGLVVSPLTSAAFSRLPPLVRDAPLPPAPDPALIQTTSGGRLPTISADGRLPRQVYARSHDGRDERARLVIIIAGIGLSRAASEAAIDRLPGVIVLAIDAYAAHPDDWAPAARRHRHEILATIPLEDADFPFRDDGPRALRVAASADENVQRLHSLLGSFTGYVGALAVGGTAFDEDVVSLQSVLDGAGARTVARGRHRKSRDSAHPHVRAARTAADSSRCLHRRLPRRRVDRSAVGQSGDDRSRAIRGRRPGWTLPKTLERLRAWISALDDRRYVLAPVSAVVDTKDLR